MVKIRIDSVKEDDEKKYFYVSADIGTQRSRSINFKTKNITFSINNIIETIKKENNIDDLDFIPTESITELRYNSSKGVCVFKKKHVDNLNKNVKIHKTIEAESPILEQEKEASLPYGLKKQTKTRRKKATKKKTIEE